MTQKEEKLGQLNYKFSRKPKEITQNCVKLSHYALSYLVGRYRKEVQKEHSLNIRMNAVLNEKNARKYYKSTRNTQVIIRRLHSHDYVIKHEAITLILPFKYSA